MTREIELDRQRDLLEAAQDKHVASGAELSAEATALSRILRALDNSDGAAVDSYNARNDERNQRVAEHNKRAEALNAALADLQSAQSDYMAECSARPYLKADEEAVRKELKLERRPTQSKEVEPRPSHPLTIKGSV